ncbi:hypothetical protein [Kocuria sp.]|uniref:hypothetical protein n=1 Tax=Kocuria sp. TaxID=1871328 RepID=UPI0026DA98DE|nr:hypothetical protein [Kocuria sp.]MDO4919089.1 hypothetical protein [Kocuria sp.]
MDALQPLRQAKHQAFLTRRLIGRGLRRAVDTGFRAYDRALPYRFDPEAHRDRYGSYPRMYFLHRQAPAPDTISVDVPRRIFCFWTGANPMSDARARCLHSMRAVHKGLEVVLVTPETLDRWLVPGHPLHPAYEHLSLVHRSDYLRAYFMTHHGGGYADIKIPTRPWTGAFDALQHHPDTWLLGYPERSSRSCGGDDYTRLGRDIHRHYGSLVGFGGFIMRGRTPFGYEWMQELDRRLDYFQEELAQHPGGVWGDTPGYPLRWIDVGSDVFHPLQLKYLPHVAQHPDILPVLGGGHR